MALYVGAIALIWNQRFDEALDPFLRGLRGEPRFTRLLNDVKREWESLEF